MFKLNKLMNLFLEDFGRKPICNKKASRGFFIGKFCFPLCTRCTAIIFSFFLSKYFFYNFLATLNMNIFVIVSIILPCFFDAVAQYRFGIESSNYRRLVTGLVCGFGIELLFIYAGRSYQI